MKILYLLSLLCALSFPAWGQQVVVLAPGSNCVPNTDCLLHTNNTWTQNNQFLKGAVLGPTTVAGLVFFSPSDGQTVVVSDSASPGNCTVGGGGNRSLCVFNVQTGFWVGAGGGVNCPAGTPAIPYFDGANTNCDFNFTSDGAGNISLVSASASGNGSFGGVVSGLSFSTSGAGGILQMKAQSAPTPAATLFDIYIDTATGLVHCRNSSSGDCLGAVQFVVSGSTVLSATLVTANGGCNVYSSTATGATSSNAAWPSLHGVDIFAISGYGPGQLEVGPPFVGTNLVSFKVCNPTAANITPGSAVTVFWDIQ